MSSRHASPSLPLLILGGAVVGAFSWFAASVVSGTFEPYDSGVGLLLNQIILSVPAIVLAWRHRITVPLLFLVSAYPGLNAYAWAFGSSEARAWGAWRSGERASVCGTRGVRARRRSTSPSAPGAFGD